MRKFNLKLFNLNVIKFRDFTIQIIDYKKFFFYIKFDII